MSVINLPAPPCARNASTIDAWVSGENAARDGRHGVPPREFTPAAQAVWIIAYELTLRSMPHAIQ